MLIFYIFMSTAEAVPLQLSQQGRMLDASGAAVTGYHDITFRVYDDISIGLLLWEEVLTVDFNNGYYAAVLGTDELNNPLDESVLSLYPLYLELEVDGSGPLSPRQPILSAPYAQMSGQANSLSGGPVDATQISIGGNLLIDGSGSWVGPTIATNWSDIIGIPSDIADGDNDTQLSETQVEGFISNDPIDLASGSSMNSSPILTEASTLSPDWVNIQNRPVGLDDGDDDSLSNITCSDGQSLVFDAASSSWTCAILADTLSSTTCADGEILSYNQGAGTWDCTSFNALIDQDSDGVLAWNDCNDNDSSNTSNRLYDLDCDGILTVDDCDDNDVLSNAISDDGDCDGILTLDDCDDGDSNSFAVVDDLDCDGYSNTVDCDSNDSNAYDDNGQSSSCAAYSCFDILNSGYNLGDGTYWVDPANGTPVQALCDMTSEGGGYTYYGVSNGVTTSRFTDNNTCKGLGMDIVFPRSQLHWDSMLARFDNSYFLAIPGVYKTSNGGNYTNCTMNSNGCSDWRVGDGGRWWLRSSNYSEPNGDYTANCWLETRSVSPSSSIEFNDGFCSYSTSKYVCSTNDKP